MTLLTSFVTQKYMMFMIIKMFVTVVIELKFFITASPVHMSTPWNSLTNHSNVVKSPGGGWMIFNFSIVQVHFGFC